MKRILVVNDDGINAPGLLALAKAVKDLGEVKIVAPREQRTGWGVSITIFRPLRVENFSLDGLDAYVVDGTPADCAILGIGSIFSEKPDIVLSGYNSGANLSQMAVPSSGTIGAAIEAAMDGIPAVAFSFEVSNLKEAMEERSSQIDYEGVRDLVRRLTHSIIETGLPVGADLLSICIPAKVSPQTDLEFTRLAPPLYRKEVVRGTDPYGLPYYWIKVCMKEEGVWEVGTDVHCLFGGGRISITPLSLDATAKIEKGKLEEFIGRVRTARP